MSYTVHPVEMPLALLSQTNGSIDPALLIPVGPKGLLFKNAARAWAALCSDARNNGFLLTYTYGGTYRDFAAQEWLFNSRYAIGGLYGGCKTYNSNSYCKKGNFANAAVPRRSNHGLGIAIDMALDMSWENGAHPNDAVNITPALEFLQKSVYKYGFSWEDLSELWHIRYVAGDKIPEAVLMYEYLIEGPVEMNYTLYRDKRFNNVFRVGDSATTVGELLFNLDISKGVPYIQDIHDQSLICYMRQSHLKKAQMVPSDFGGTPFEFPEDLI